MQAHIEAFNPKPGKPEARDVANVVAFGRVKRSWPQADGARRPRLAALAWAGGSSDLAS